MSYWSSSPCVLAFAVVCLCATVVRAREYATDDDESVDSDGSCGVACVVVLTTVAVIVVGPLMFGFVVACRCCCRRRCRCLYQCRQPAQAAAVSAAPSTPVTVQEIPPTKWDDAPEVPSEAVEVLTVQDIDDDDDDDDVEKCRHAISSGSSGTTSCCTATTTTATTASSVMLVECPFCVSEVPRLYRFSTRCRHPRQCCRQCLHRYIETALGELERQPEQPVHIRCCFVGCPRTLRPSDLSLFADNDGGGGGGGDREQSPLLDRLLRVEAAHASEVQRTAFLRGCSVADAAYLSMCKRCPHCSRLIERTEGCDHMRCDAASGGCGGTFCWRCLRTDNTCESQCTQ